MPISFRPQAGQRQTGTANARTISTIDSNGLVTTTAAITGGIPVGSMAEIFGTTTKGNKGFFTVIEQVTTSQYRLRPKPIAQGASGTLARCNDLPSYTLGGASTLTSVLVDSFDTAKAFVQVAGANFKANGVQRNDRLQIINSSTTANNGAWIIQEVISESVVLVRPPDLGELMKSEAVGTGTVSVKHGRIRIEIANIGNNSWSRIVSEAVSRKGPFASKFYTFGSGKISDYIKLKTIGDGATGEQRTLVSLEGIAVVSFYQSTPSDLTFYSLDEIVIANQTTGTHGTCDFAEINQSSWATGLTVQLGNQPGNRYSAGNGSAWIAVVPSVSGNINNVSPTVQAAARTHVNAYGSFLDLTGINETNLLGGNVTASIMRPRTNTGTGVIESLIAYGDSGNASGGLSGTSAGDQNNILVANQGSTSAIGGTGTIIGGLLVSDTLLTPIAFNNNISGGGVVEIRDPRIDLDLNDYFSNSSSDSEVIKTYQFNPRFVSRDAATSTPEPVFYLTVDVIEINETTLDTTLLMHDVTNAAGLLVGGARYLTRQQILGSAETSTLYSHRVILEGAGFKIQNEIIQLTSPRIGDYPVSRVSPDYEGEFGE